MHRGNRRKYHPESRFNVSPRAIPQKSGPAPMGYDPRLTDPSRQVDPRAVPSRIAQGAGPSGKFAGQEYLRPTMFEPVKVKRSDAIKPPGFRSTDEGSFLDRLGILTLSPEFQIAEMFTMQGALKGGVKVTGTELGGGVSRRILDRVPLKTKRVLGEISDREYNDYLTRSDLLTLGSNDLVKAIKTTRGQADDIQIFFGRRTTTQQAELIQREHRHLQNVYTAYRQDKDKKMLLTLFDDFQREGVAVLDPQILNKVAPNFGRFPFTLQKAMVNLVEGGDEKGRRIWSEWVGKLAYGGNNAARDALGQYGLDNPRALAKLHAAIRAEFGDVLIVFRGTRDVMGGLTTSAGKFTGVSTDIHYASRFGHGLAPGSKLEMARIHVKDIAAFGGIDESELIISTNFVKTMTWVTIGGVGASGAVVGANKLEHPNIRRIDADG